MITRVVWLISRYSHLNWALADQAMVSGANFMTGLLLARYLGLEEFGRFTLAWMVVLFVNNLQGALVVSPMMSIGPQQRPDEEPAYYGAVAVQQFLVGVATFLTVWGGVEISAALFPEWNISGLALPLTCAALGGQLQEYLRRYFFVRQRAVVAFGIDALRYMGQLAVLFWLFQTARMDSTGALWTIAALAFLSVLVFGSTAVGGHGWDRDAFRAIVRRHWHFSKWLTGSALIQWATGNLFVVAAGALLGAWAVGALKAAQNLTGVAHILFLGLENIVPARAARLFRNNGKQALRGYLWRVIIYGELVTGGIAGVMFVAPEFWLALVFGDEYRGYGYLLQWCAIINLMVFLGFPLRAGFAPACGRSSRQKRFFTRFCALCCSASLRPIHWSRHWG
jgi:O-antigen/teichoic acid export membrane protein